MILNKIGKHSLFILLQCAAAIEIFILIGALPSLFADLSIHLDAYFLSALDLTKKLFTLQELTVKGYPLLPILIGRYLFSMKIFLLGVLLAIFLSSITSYFCLLFFRKKRKVFLKLLDILESVPDLLFITGLQMLVILIYKSSGLKVAQVISMGADHQTVLLPVISLSIPASFFFTKIILIYVEEEMKKNYVLLAKSIGFSYTYILNVHVLRNIIRGLIVNSKTLYWSMLSSLMVIEYLYGMNGLLSLMLGSKDNTVFTVSCLFIYLPFYLFYRLLEWKNPI